MSKSSHLGVSRKPEFTYLKISPTYQGISLPWGLLKVQVHHPTWEYTSDISPSTWGIPTRGSTQSPPSYLGVSFRYKSTYLGVSFRLKSTYLGLSSISEVGREVDGRTFEKGVERWTPEKLNLLPPPVSPWNYKHLNYHHPEKICKYCINNRPISLIPSVIRSFTLGRKSPTT